jgi:ketosteroid isomerase-like protein
VSQQNVELHRRAFQAFNARDIDALLALSDPSIEGHSVFTEVSGVYHGHEGARRFFGDLEDAWGGDLRLKPEAYFDLGEHTLVFYLARARGRQSGAEITRQHAQVLRWREGLCTYWKAYTRRQDALRELGVSEDVLEPIPP